MVAEFDCKGYSAALLTPDNSYPSQGSCYFIDESTFCELSGIGNTANYYDKQ